MYEGAVQKSIFKAWLAEVAYAGSQGKRLSKRYNADPPATPGVLYRVTPSAVPYPNLGSILYSSQAGKSALHALNLKLERRVPSGLSPLTSSSWSPPIATASARACRTPNPNPAQLPPVNT